MSLVAYVARQLISSNLTWQRKAHHFSGIWQEGLFVSEQLCLIAEGYFIYTLIVLLSRTQERFRYGQYGGGII